MTSNATIPKINVGRNRANLKNTATMTARGSRFYESPILRILHISIRKAVILSNTLCDRGRESLLCKEIKIVK